jgi:P27 family predicted phage terminase small subunit
MKKVKPTAVQKGKITKEKYQQRQKAENSLKGKKPIQKTPPSDLCPQGKKVYKEILESMPKDFLSNLDLNTVTTCADAIANMQKCREMINTEGVVIDSKQNQALLAYSKYSEIFRKYADDLGLSPASRAKLALIKSEQIEEETDPLLKVLKGGQ